MGFSRLGGAIAGEQLEAVDTGNLEDEAEVVDSMNNFDEGR